MLIHLTTVFINNVPLATAPVRHSSFSTRRWRVCVFGAGVDTRALVRNLQLWEGTRY